LFLWAGSLAAANWKGFSPMVSACFLAIPVLVFWVTLRLMPPQGKRGSRFYAVFIITRFNKGVAIVALSFDKGSVFFYSQSKSGFGALIFPFSRKRNTALIKCQSAVRFKA
jgi:hypothetical protein